MIRITKKDGKIYLSSLFNIDLDVDIYSKVYDYTREGDKNGGCMAYNTYSKYIVNKWIKDKVQFFKIHKFNTDIDFSYNGKGVGTFTKECKVNKIQISGGMLMNWGILEIKK